MLFPNELGLYDMSGNLWKWCWDAWNGTTAYGTAPYTGTLYDPDFSGQAWSSGFLRVVRGGSWDGTASITTVAYRNDDNQYYDDNGVGIRVVRY